MPNAYTSNSTQGADVEHQECVVPRPLYTCAFVCVCVYVHVYVHVYVSVCVCAFVCVCVCEP